jgi:hypothetical protein
VNFENCFVSTTISIKQKSFKCFENPTENVRQTSTQKSQQLMLSLGSNFVLKIQLKSNQQQQQQYVFD